MEKPKKIAQDFLKGIGKFIPGFNKLIENVQKFPIIQKRLKEVNEEIEKRIKDGLRLRK